MDRSAIFVDAGYLFAQGSTALTGSKKARTSLIFDAVRAVDELKRLAQLKAPDNRLLRVYWYDGAIGGVRPTTDQAFLAHLDDVKLRLGFLNSTGQQKGVDSLIVTDLIELARLKSISDALLVSGDEDVRIGVQIAQNHGVRVHLLGITPSRGSQSPQLLQEADTTTEWTADTIRLFLSVRDAPAPMASVVVNEVLPLHAPISVSHDFGRIEVSVQTFVQELGSTDIQGIAAYWETARGVPSEFDRKLLPVCGAAIGHNLDRDEIRHMRSCFQAAVRSRLGHAN